MADRERTLPKTSVGDAARLNKALDAIEALPIIVPPVKLDENYHIGRVIVNTTCRKTHVESSMKQPHVALNKKLESDPAAVPTFAAAAERLLARLETEHAACIAKDRAAEECSAAGSTSFETGAARSCSCTNPFTAMMELRAFEQRVEAAKKAEFEAARATKVAMAALDEHKVRLYGRKAARSELAAEECNWERWCYHDWTYQEKWTQERRAVPLSAGVEVTPPRDGQDGFLHHPRRGMVGNVQDWARGSLHWAVFMILALIRHLNIVEKVRAGLPKSKAQREADTNAKIVDLLEQGLAETKHCRSEQQRQEFHIGLGYVMPPRLAQGWYARICARLKVQRGKRSEARGARPYAADQAVDRRAQFDKDVALQDVPLKEGDTVLAHGDECVLERICAECDVEYGADGPPCVLSFSKDGAEEQHCYDCMYGKKPGSARLQRPPPTLAPPPRVKGKNVVDVVTRALIKSHAVKVCPVHIWLYTWDGTEVLVCHASCINELILLFGLFNGEISKFSSRGAAPHPTGGGAERPRPPLQGSLMAVTLDPASFAELRTAPTLRPHGTALTHSRVHRHSTRTRHRRRRAARRRPARTYGNRVTESERRQ